MSLLPKSKASGTGWSATNFFEIPFKWFRGTPISGNLHIWVCLKKKKKLHPKLRWFIMVPGWSPTSHTKKHHNLFVPRRLEDPSKRRSSTNSIPSSCRKPCENLWKPCFRGDSTTSTPSEKKKNKITNPSLSGMGSQNWETKSRPNAWEIHPQQLGPVRQQISQYSTWNRTSTTCD